MKNYIRPSRLYEFTLEQLENSTFNIEDEEKVLENLEALTWVKDIFKRMTPMLLKAMYDKTIEDIENESVPVDIMALSCIVWHFKEHGMDTTLIESVINTSSYVANELEKQFRERAAIN